MRSGILTILMLFVFALPCTAENFAGSVKTVNGDCRILRGEQSMPAQKGQHVLQGDVLETGSGSMGVTFRDDTMLSMGPGSRISVDSFVFDPAGKSTDFLVNMTRGTAQFITGQMAKVAPESMKVRTPLSTIGIRGTRFLVKVP